MTLGCLKEPTQRWARSNPGEGNVPSRWQGLLRLWEAEGCCLAAGETSTRG
eukprot:CAMPEP_0174330430 /NCGR_PEP_ID=MMETSP0810-20121108/16673_1 /TAXON_ID=73025 ORGANISM="Eutreptiella gymnastica-like, Strain CCMP1594" /NCGR_SAMPLE_ID=MMETSP0810 /ASSEMBLY_ACC=CAM_ASM_000659 /LENGTH=50 /DNA_ID=CAMNT_0015445597 /DNA_START=870 /DNA_END=1018 /DNA_ORIENTATION=+